MTSNIDTTTPQPSIGKKARNAAEEAKDWIVGSAVSFRDDSVEFAKEVYHECIPEVKAGAIEDSLRYLGEHHIHIPYFPAFHRPGWMVRYVVGPYDSEWAQSAIADIVAGITVGMTLIPQGLSYATLANLPAIVGLYTAIIPSAVYTFFGSSLQLAVGPVALVSLLCGQIVTKYVPDFATNTEAAITCAGQASLCCGIILCGMSLFNLGYLINFMSHPVMSGFTTGAAMIIGANQLKGAFGFSNEVPQTGQPGYHYNWEVFEWFAHNWNGKYNYDYLTAKGIKLTSKQKFANHRWYRNFIATRICFGLYCPLMFIILLKQNILPATAARRKTTWYTIFTFVCNMCPFLALVIGTHVAWRIKHDDHYTDTRKLYVHNYYASTLKVVGMVPSGLNILRTPKFELPFGPFFVDCIPLTLISFMEGYAVARRIGAQRNELHILNASQEMFAMGAANLLASIGTAYPVSGSFSRSSLNHTSGARTPLSKVACLSLILLVLGTLTSFLQYVPNAALAAIIWAAIYNLVAFSDLWEAWKHSKKDFLIMFVTMAIVVIWNTDYALAVGMGLSVFVTLINTRTSKATEPVLVKSNALDGEGIDIVVINSELNFVQASRIKDFVSLLTLQTPAVPDANSKQRVIADTIAKSFDYVLTPFPLKTVETLPKAIILDFNVVRGYDLTGLESLAEILHETRQKGVLVVMTNLFPLLAEGFKNFGIKNDSSVPGLDLEAYAATAGLDRRPAKVTPIEPSPPADDKEFGYAPVEGKESTDDVEAATPSTASSIMPSMPDPGINPAIYFTHPKSEKE